MISVAPTASHPTRAAENARTYSSTWNRAVHFRGIRTCVTRPWRTVQSLTMPIVPPTATVVASSRNGLTARWIASRPSRLSPSSVHTSGVRQWLTPTLSASALPPFSLSTSQRFGRSRLR